MTRIIIVLCMLISLSSCDICSNTIIKEVEQDIIKLQVELSNIIKKIAQLEQNRKSLVAHVNQLLDREATLSIAPVGEVQTVLHKDGLIQADAPAAAVPGS